MPAFSSADWVPVSQKLLLAQRKAKKEQYRDLWREAAAAPQKIQDLIMNKYRPRFLAQWGAILCPEHFKVISKMAFAVSRLNATKFDHLYDKAAHSSAFLAPSVNNQQQRFLKFRLVSTAIKSPKEQNWKREF